LDYSAQWFDGRRIDLRAADCNVGLTDAWAETVADHVVDIVAGSGLGDLDGIGPEVVKFSISSRWKGREFEYGFQGSLASPDGNGDCASPRLGGSNTRSGLQAPRRSRPSAHADTRPNDAVGS
jgi:hypothetical protein